MEDLETLRAVEDVIGGEGDLPGVAGDHVQLANIYLHAADRQLRSGTTGESDDRLAIPILQRLILRLSDVHGEQNVDRSRRRLPSIFRLATSTAKPFWSRTQRWCTTLLAEIVRELIGQEHQQQSPGRLYALLTFFHVVAADAAARDSQNTHNTHSETITTDDIDSMATFILRPQLDRAIGGEVVVVAAGEIAPSRGGHLGRQQNDGGEEQDDVAQEDPRAQLVDDLRDDLDALWAAEEVIAGMGVPGAITTHPADHRRLADRYLHRAGRQYDNLAPVIRVLQLLANDAHGDQRLLLQRAKPPILTPFWRQLRRSYATFMMKLAIVIWQKGAARGSRRVVFTLLAMFHLVGASASSFASGFVDSMVVDRLRPELHDAIVGLGRELRQEELRAALMKLLVASHEDTIDQTCGLCSQTYEGDDDPSRAMPARPVQLACGHRFHLDCILERNILYFTFLHARRSDELHCPSCPDRSGSKSTS